LGAAIRAAVISRHVLLAAVRKRLPAEILIRNDIGRSERMRMCGNLWRSRLALGLIFVGLPGIRLRRFVAVIIFDKRLPDEEFRPAEPAELARIGVGLAAILTLNHSNTGMVGEFHKLI